MRRVCRGSSSGGYHKAGRKILEISNASLNPVEGAVEPDDILGMACSPGLLEEFRSGNGLLEGIEINLAMKQQGRTSSSRSRHCQMSNVCHGQRSPGEGVCKSLY